MDSFDLIPQEELLPVLRSPLQTRVNSPCPSCEIAQSCTKFDSQAQSCVIADNATMEFQHHLGSAKHLLTMDTLGLKQLAGLYASLCIMEEALFAQGAFQKGYVQDLKTKKVKEVFTLNGLHSQYLKLQRQFLQQLHEFGLTPLGRASAKTKAAYNQEQSSLAVYIQNNYGTQSKTQKLIDATP